MLRTAVLSVLLSHVLLAVDPDAPALPPGRWVEAEVTAYCPCPICCGQDANGITATGIHVSRRPYGIAADPSVVPYGSQVWIPTGYGILDRAREGERLFTVDDTGSRVVSEGRESGLVRLDVRVIAHRYAQLIGRQRLRVYLCDAH